MQLANPLFEKIEDKERKTLKGIKPEYIERRKIEQIKKINEDFKEDYKTIFDI